jgi:hypothetical protein
MNKLIAFLALFLTICVSPARAQIAVLDPANLAQTILIVQRTQRHLEEIQAQYQTILRMAERLGAMDRYRTPPIALVQHELDRWSYGRPWIQALNAGDPTGAAYLATAMPLERPDAASRLEGTARQVFERMYGAIEIADSVAMMGGHQVGITRGFFNELQRVVQALESDVLNSGSSNHDMTANLDKIAAGELLSRRQDMVTNQLLSHVLEQLLSRGKQLRDTNATALNMQLVTWRDAEKANRAFREGAGDALRTWRQP